MNIADDDLKRPLPPGLRSGALGGWTLYQSFRTFTWPWWVRRGAVFWPLAILAGFAYAAWHASGMNGWRDWPSLALYASFGSLVAVSAGPLMATGVRHLRLPFEIERVLVIAAILLGLWIGSVALHMAENHHGHLMQAYSGRSMDVGWFGRLMSQFFRSSVDASTFALIFGGGGLAIFYYLSERRRIAQYTARRLVESLRSERDAADMRLAVLQAQVEPHFLFNTLASVRSLIANEPERAAETVEALADYLRATLPRLRESAVEDATLDRQLDICTRYLALMNIRMAGRIDVQLEADDAVRELPFPPLLLLTLVENAVTHGVERKPGPAIIAIRAKIEDGDLVVTVDDDGPGLEPGLTPGVGLANVRAQLRSRFGDRARLDIATRREGGARAQIRIPASTP